MDSKNLWQINFWNYDFLFYKTCIASFKMSFVQFLLFDYKVSIFQRKYRFFILKFLTWSFHMFIHFAPGLGHLGRFLSSTWVRQLKFWEFAWFRISWNLLKFEFIWTTFIFISSKGGPFEKIQKTYYLRLYIGFWFF